MKKSIILVFVLVLAISLAFSGLVGCKTTTTAETTAAESVSQGSGESAETTGVVAGEESKSVFAGSPDETYYMVTFLSGAEYWIGCFNGFKAAGDLFGVKTVYTGAAEYDINKEVTAFEQVVGQSPAGIGISCVNGDGFVETINKAIEAGVPVIGFDSDSPNSKRLTFLCVDNEVAGYQAGKKTIEVLKTGKIAILERVGQEALDKRVKGYKRAIEESNGAMEVVAHMDAGGDEAKAATAVASMIQANPDIVCVFASTGIEAIGAATAVKESGKDIKVVSFDADKPVLDLIKEGTIIFTLYENTWSMGFWTMTMLYDMAHGLVNPPNGWKEAGISPLPPYVNTGINIIDKSNADLFYIK
jgi:ribose transport system substrate-binding protein